MEIIVWTLYSEDGNLGVCIILKLLEQRMEYEISFYGPCIFTFVFSFPRWTPFIILVFLVAGEAKMDEN